MRARVDYWEKWGGEEQAAMSRLVCAFNESQTRYEVVLISTGDTSSSPDLEGFLAAQRGGQPPDLIGLEAHEIAALTEQEALRSLGTGLVNRARSLLRPGVVRLGEARGSLVALPIVADLVTLYVNGAAVCGTPFEEGVPRSVGSFDVGLDALAKRGQVGFVPTYPGWWPESWPLFFGGGWFDERGRFAPEREENVRAYQWVAGFRRRFDLQRFAKTVNPLGAASPDPFLEGDVAFVLEGDWVVRRLVREPGLDWSVAPFPTWDGRGGTLLEADLLAIPSGARCPEGAAAFLSFLLDPARIEALALGQGKVSPLSRASPGFVASHPNPRLSDLCAIWDDSRVFSPPAHPEWLTIRARVREAFRAMWEEAKSPQEALARLSL
jgi:ABC-type glycerol-3-phosphate transport system substrate-binding protein